MYRGRLLIKMHHSVSGNEMEAGSVNLKAWYSAASL